MSEDAEGVKFNEYGEMGSPEKAGRLSFITDRVAGMAAMLRWTRQMIRDGEYLYHIPVIRSHIKIKPKIRIDKDYLDKLTPVVVDKEGNLIPKTKEL